MMTNVGFKKYQMRFTFSCLVKFQQQFYSQQIGNKNELQP